MTARAGNGDDGEPLPASKHCFVCGRQNELGLQLEFRRVRAGTMERVETSCALDARYNGFQHRAHGGVAAALLDEAMGWATVLAAHRFTYTVELVVRYREPVPLEEEVTVSGWVERATRRLAFAAGELRAAADGRVLATASGKFMPVSAEESERIADALLYDRSRWRLSPADRR